MGTNVNQRSGALRRFIPGGPTLLTGGVLAGLAWPELANALRPLMPITIFIFVLGTLLRADVRMFVEAAKKPYVSSVLPFLAMLACPLATAVIARSIGIDTQLSLAMVLAAAAPPSSGTAAIARMLGLDPVMPLAATLVSMAVAPLTIAMISAVIGGVSLDPIALADRLVTMIGTAGIAALVLRFSASSQLGRHHAGVDGTILVGLLVFAVTTMAGVRQQIEGQPILALVCLVLAFGSNIALQLVGVLSASGTCEQRLAAGLVLGNRNVGLIWSAMGSAVSPRMALFFAATQFPIYILPRVLEVLLRHVNKDSIRHD